MDEVNQLVINKLIKLIEGGKFNRVELAKKCKISRTTIENILSGSDFKLSNLKKIARAYEVPMSFFFDESSIAISSEPSQLLRMLEAQINNNMRLTTTNASLVADNQRLRGAVAPTGKGLPAAAGE